MIDVAPQRDDRVLAVTFVVTVLVMIALFLGGVLYVLPADTSTRWAWPVQPPLTAMTMGAGYLSGAILFVRALLSRRWHIFSLAFLGATVLGWMLLLATLIHWDRFSHQLWQFQAWLVIYVAAPIALPALWWINRRTDPGVAEDELLVPPTVRRPLAAIGAFQLAFGLVIFVWPDIGIRLWPWALTPLTARTLTGFISFVSVLWLAFGFESRWSALRLPVGSVSLALALIAIAVLRSPADLTGSALHVAVFMSLLAGALAGMVWLLVTMRRRAISD